MHQLGIVFKEVTLTTLRRWNSIIHRLLEISSFTRTMCTPQQQIFHTDKDGNRGNLNTSTDVHIVCSAFLAQVVCSAFLVQTIIVCACTKKLHNLTEYTIVNYCRFPSPSLRSSASVTKPAFLTVSIRSP